MPEKARPSGKKRGEAVTLDLMGDGAEPVSAAPAVEAAAPAALAVDAAFPAPPVGLEPDEALREDESDPFADPPAEEDPFAETVMAQMLADEPVPLGSPLRAAREELKRDAVEAEEEDLFEAQVPPELAPAPASPRPAKAARSAASAPSQGASVAPSQGAPGLTIPRRYTQPNQDVWTSCEWELRTASIVGSDGTVVFEQKGVEIPKFWSQLATNVVVSKYFRGHVGTLEREYSVKQLIGRVTDRILEWGKAGHYFATDEDAQAFSDELRYILLHQLAAFNSPVWFNLGWPGRRQAVSACYINEVEDTMESILDLYKTEGMLFKDGSGSGLNLSILRSSKEPLEAGGKSSGPISFMKGLDASAGSIKSGGSTRRAACMRVLDIDHPDIQEFIDCKKDAEEKAHALIDAGYSGAFNVPGGAYDTVPFQNANHSVRVSDAFMEAVEADGTWETKYRLSGKTAGTLKARDLIRSIAEGTWTCGDPGMQYDTTINDWHTVSNTDRIYASNPCCVTADTLIAVADGRNAVAIKDLVGTEVSVFAHDHAAGRTAVSRMWNIGIKRESAPVYRVTLDDGSTFRATDDHLIMLRDGSYRMVRDLRSGDPVMPFHSKVLASSPVRTEQHYYWSGRSWEHSLPLKVEGRRPAGERYERCCPVCRGNYTTRRIEQIFCSDACRCSPMGREMSGEKIRVQARNTVLKAARLLLDHGVEPALETWDDLRKSARTLGAGRVPTAATARRYFAGDAELREHAALYNHKVVSVEFCGHEDVYDGTVDTHHNFAILTSAESSCAEGALNYSGLFIHNSEFMHLNSTACNLASLNLMRFRQEDAAFDAESFEHAVRIVITAQEIMVGFADYPTPKITQRSHEFRPLGLGYANLGALLMAAGLPYDSDAGRAYAGAVTALMTGRAYHQSALIARDCGGPFSGFAPNREPMLRVMRKHREAVDTINRKLIPDSLLLAARRCWDDAVEVGARHGYRNAQASVLAPTGCLVGDSLVLTSRGLVRLQSLGDPEGRQWQTLDVEVATDEGPRSASRFYVNGVEAVVTVETGRGYRIQGTPTHRIRVVDDAGKWQWRRFAEIKTGDRVPLMLGGMVGEANAVPLPPLPEGTWGGDLMTRAPGRMTPDLAELAGYFMGNGALHSQGLRLDVTRADRDVAARLAVLGQSLFGLEPAVTEHSDRIEVAYPSGRLALWWVACGFAKHPPAPGRGSRLYAAHIPDAVLQTNDRDVYTAFVRGALEAGTAVSGGEAVWTTGSERFSRDMQSLLLALGFVSTRQAASPAVPGQGGDPGFALRLLPLSLTGRFSAQVGFQSRRKSALLQAQERSQAVLPDQIPLSRDLVDLLAPADDSLRRTLLQSLDAGGAVPRPAAEELLARARHAKLGHLLEFFYDQVAAAELGEEQMTYDLSVPDNVTYVANGFVSHNTIGFLMDCDTTGIEPDIAIVKYKSLVGGGMMKIVNQTVPEALQRLGYTEAQVAGILAFIGEHDTIEGAPALEPEHLPIFDCAFRPTNGTRSIHYMGHVKMMAAAQPFLSGAISKTVNVPNDATPETIADAYLQAWKLGIKALAIYRDGSKRTQPLSTSREAPAGEKVGAAGLLADGLMPPAVRRRLPDERASLTHKFSIGGHEGYLTVGLYPDTRQPGEIFIRMSKEGSSISGLMDSFATAISLALQYGVPLSTLVDKFIHSRFEPSGFTGNKDIPMAKSVMDYIFRYLALKFLQKEDRHNVGLIADQEPEKADDAPAALPEPSRAPGSLPTHDAKSGTLSNGNGSKNGLADSSHLAQNTTAALTDHEREIFRMQSDAPPCPECGAITIRSGACYKCLSCGTSLGCS